MPTHGGLRRPWLPEGLVDGARIDPTNLALSGPDGAVSIQCFSLVAQVAFVDFVFWRYGGHGYKWKIPTTAISVWLSAAAVQIIGVVVVVTHYRFPNRDGRAGPSSGPATRVTVESVSQQCPT
jgi:hypothetical protein